MYINMYILINMNIYITKQNEEFLKGLPTEQSMSGLINELLNDVRAAASTLPEKRIKEIFTPPKIPGVVKGSDFVPKPPDPETGYPCCTKAKPCKHWAWDSTDTVWRNSLTGKTKEE